MKKTTTLLLSFLLIIPCIFGIVGCKKKNTEPPTPPEPTPVEITMEQYISAVDKAIDTHYNNERFANWTARKLERTNKTITTSYSNYTYKKQATDEDTVTEVLPMITDIASTHTFVRVGTGFDTKILVKKDETETTKSFDVQADQTLLEKISVTRTIEQFLIGKIVDEANQNTIYRVAKTVENFNEDGSKKESGNVYTYYDYKENEYKTFLENIINNVNNIFVGADLDYSIEFIGDAENFSTITQFNDVYTHTINVYPTITMSGTVKNVLEGLIVREITNNAFTDFKFETTSTDTNYKTDVKTVNYNFYDISYVYDNVTLNNEIPTDEDGYSMNFSKYQYYNITSLLN